MIAGAWTGTGVDSMGDQGDLGFARQAPVSERSRWGVRCRRVVQLSCHRQTGTFSGTIDGTNLPMTVSTTPATACDSCISAPAGTA